MMPGVTFGEIRDAIVDAYNNQDLEEVLRFYMNVRLDDEIAPGAFRHRVFELIEWSEMRGLDVELVRITARARPSKARMQQIYKKYGMAIPVLVQDSGTAVPATPTDAADGGLEKIVRPHLSFADFGIWRERMTRVEGQVCRITLNGAARGTGFLVGPDAVLTNFHVFEPVLKDPKTATGIKCQFDYKLLANQSRTETPVGLHPTDWLIDACPYTEGEGANDPDRTTPTADELDYTLVRLADPLGLETGRSQPQQRGSAPGPRLGPGAGQGPDVRRQDGDHHRRAPRRRAPATGPGHRRDRPGQGQDTRTAPGRDAGQVRHQHPRRVIRITVL